MIRKISNIKEHLKWLAEYLCDTSFSSPFCNEDRMISVSEKDDHILLGAYKEQKLAGIFCLMVSHDEKTIETIFMCSKESTAYEELIGYLSEYYIGYEVWFVFNPKNAAVKNCLIKRNAYFYTEQRYMEYQGHNLPDTKEIVPYCKSFQDEYVKIHDSEGYWNGEKVLENIRDFDVFLCIRDNRLVGYIDLSKGSDLVEIMDIWILPEYRNQGIGTLLLRKAVSFVKSKRLILTVDVDNDPANHLYEKMGFREILSNNCMTARYML